MKNSKLILGIAAGAVVIAGITLIATKKRRAYLVAEGTNEHYANRLKKLQRKAQKEFKELGNNAAIERASQWAGKIPGGK